VILSTLSKEMTAEFGSGCSVPNPSRVTRFAEDFPGHQIVAALSRQLSWSLFWSHSTLRRNPTGRLHFLLSTVDHAFCRRTRCHSSG
jgi:hypothetical protein